MTASNIRQQFTLSAWGWFSTLAICLALTPLVSEPRYLMVAGILLAVVVATGAGLRLTRLPRLAILSAQLLVAVEFVVLAFTESILPTFGAYDALAARLAAFSDSAEMYAAPLPRDGDTTMAFALIVLGVGILVDLVGVTMRRVPVLGLLFLLVYMVPVAQLGGEVSLTLFIPGAVGFVFMLAADERERLTHWGRQIRTMNASWAQGSSEVDDSGLTRSRLRIGFGAVALAAVLPLLLPSVSPRILFEGGSGDGSGDGDGDGPVQVDDPTLDMRRNLDGAGDEVLVRVTGDDEPAYFRLAALDDFTGNVWRVGERQEDIAVSTDQRLPVPTGSQSLSMERVDYVVELTDELDTSWLPSAYAPRLIDIDTPWLVDPVNLDIRADSNDDPAGTTYRLSATIPNPSTSQLQAAGPVDDDLASFLRLPPDSDVPSIIEQTAREATAGARPGIDQALALQSWFRDDGDYTYSLEQVAGDRNRTGLDAVAAFLEERVGYCEQYASAMALMARQLGIPSRVVVGFLRAERAQEGVWEFRGDDMHSWPELYFDGVGWIRFEPTPQSVSRDAPPYGDDSTNTAAPSEPTSQATRPTRDPREAPSTQAGASGSTGDDDGGYAGTALAVAGGLGLGALIAAAPRLLRALRSRRRWGDAVGPEAAAETAWAELRDGAVDLRVHWAEGTTPRAAGRSLREQLGVGATAEVVAGLNAVVLAVERARYARSVAAAADLRTAVERVLTALADQRSAGQRRLALWLPASLWRPASAGSPPSSADTTPPGSVLTLGT
jgi:transglutaminase-like putative cysteine protease